MFTETAQQTLTDHIPTITQKSKTWLGNQRRKKHSNTSFKFKQVPLTFLRAHAVEVDHGRYDKSAQRAESVWSHEVCGWKAARCRLHKSRKFIWLTIRAGLEHGKASIRVSHPEESAPCFNSAHTHANSSTPMSHFLCTVAARILLCAFTGNSTAARCWFFSCFITTENYQFRCDFRCRFFLFYEPHPRGFSSYYWIFL